MTSPISAAATFSKDPRAWGGAVSMATAAFGPYLFCDGGHEKRYLDWVSGLGANILGNADPDFTSHLARELSLGTSFSLVHDAEYETAAKLIRLAQAHLPHWRSLPLQVRWFKNGSDATSAAVRLARAASRRWLILRLKGSYHGWHDWAMQEIVPAHGVPQQPGCVRFVEPWLADDTLPLWLSEPTLRPAAVIVEHPVLELHNRFYAELRRFCDRTGALLIMDEVVCAFRYAVMGASERYGVAPDLICLGKALGNGLPIAALIGPAELMAWFARRDPVFVSSSNAGDPISLAAASFVLDRFLERGREHIHHLWRIGQSLMAGLRQAGWQVAGHPPRSLVSFDSQAERAAFVHGMARHSILMNRPNFPNLSHEARHVEETVAAAEAVRQEWLSGHLQLPESQWPLVLFSDR